MFNYTKVSRLISTGANPGLKFIGVISRNGTMSEDQLIERIAAASSLAEGDVLSCLRQMQLEIASATLNGITVQLNQLGSFIPYLKAYAMDDIDAVDASSIKRVKVNFYPNVRFKNKLKNAKFEYRNPAPKGLQ